MHGFLESWFIDDKIRRNFAIVWFEYVSKKWWISTWFMAPQWDNLVGRKWCAGPALAGAAPIPAQSGASGRVIGRTLESLRGYYHFFGLVCIMQRYHRDCKRMYVTVPSRTVKTRTEKLLEPKLYRDRCWKYNYISLVTVFLAGVIAGRETFYTVAKNCFPHSFPAAPSLLYGHYQSHVKNLHRCTGELDISASASLIFGSRTRD